MHRINPERNQAAPIMNRASNTALGVETQIFIEDHEPLSEWAYCLYRSPFPPTGRALGIERDESEETRSRRSVTKIVGPMGSVFEIRSHR